MARSRWFVELVKKPFPHLFRIVSLTKVPVLGSLLDLLLFEGDDIVYLPRDTTLRIDEPIDVPEEVVLPSQVVEHFIEQANCHWIMDVCLCRDASRCEDYPIELGCLFLGGAASGINPRLGRPVTKEEALEHVRRCREAGLVHMIGRNKLDTVWLGVGPGERLMTICSCCPCCCLWRMLPHVAPAIGARVSRMPGVRVSVTDRCLGCGVCTQGICFADAIHLHNGRAKINGECRGCGQCVAVCPQKAIEITLDGSGAIDVTIRRLAKQVDVT
jgi:ferredoxin